MARTTSVAEKYHLLSGSLHTARTFWSLKNRIDFFVLIKRLLCQLYYIPEIAQKPFWRNTPTKLRKKMHICKFPRRKIAIYCIFTGIAASVSSKIRKNFPKKPKKNASTCQIGRANLLFYSLSAPDLLILLSTNLRNVTEYETLI